MQMDVATADPHRYLRSFNPGKPKGSSKIRSHKRISAARIPRSACKQTESLLVRDPTTGKSRVVSGSRGPGEDIDFCRFGRGTWAWVRSSITKGG